jgi:hypothetical protein
MIWFALIIPVLAAFFMYKYLKRSIVWWEMVIPLLSSILIIFILKFSVQTSMVSDTEYWGSMVTRARYYESWTTWVTKTCSYTTTCCCDSKGQNCQTQTHYYDCSYCDENSAYWMAYDNNGNSWRISQSYYESLKRKWNTSASFIELSRDIDYSHGCGDDGDAYEIAWDSRPESAEPAVTEHGYTNKVQASHSAFKMEHVSKKESKSLGLYEYPGLYNYYRQKVVMGLDSFNVDRAAIQQKYEYFNGVNGPQYKAKLFILLFHNKPISIVEKQQAFWDGGNKNELVICIGLNKDLKIDWVKPFSWTDNKRVLVDCREDIAELDTLNFDGMYDILQINVQKFKYKNFEDFNYLKIDLPGWCLWLAYLLTLLVTSGVSLWAIRNDHTCEEESDDEFISKKLSISKKDKFGFLRRKW